MSLVLDLGGHHMPHVIARRSFLGVSRGALVLLAACSDSTDATPRGLRLRLAPDSVETVPGARIILRADVVDARGRVVDRSAQLLTLTVRDSAVAGVVSGPRDSAGYVLSVRARGQTWVVGTASRGGVALVDSTWLFTGSALAAHPSRSAPREPGASRRPAE